MRLRDNSDDEDDNEPGAPEGAGSGQGETEMEVDENNDEARLCASVLQQAQTPINGDSISSESVPILPTGPSTVMLKENSDMIYQPRFWRPTTTGWRACELSSRRSS